MSQPFGLLRIDYLFSGEHVSPTGIQTDCTPRSSESLCVDRGVPGQSVMFTAEAQSEITESTESTELFLGL